jgi:hypothetical protein
MGELTAEQLREAGEVRAREAVDFAGMAVHLAQGVMAETDDEASVFNEDGLLALDRGVDAFLRAAGVALACSVDHFNRAAELKGKPVKENQLDDTEDREEDPWW